MCRICGEKILPPERAEIRTICMNERCLAVARREWGEQFRIMLIPKSGFTLVKPASSGA